MAKFSTTPQLVVDLVATKDDGSREVMEIHEGDILEDIVYSEGGATYTKTGKISAILVATDKVTPDYKQDACKMESSFHKAVKVEAIVLDSSSKYDSDANLIMVKNIKSIASVTAGVMEVDASVMEAGGVAALLDGLTPGQNLKLETGTVSEALVMNQSVTIQGVNAGVSAAKGYRCSATVENETVFNGSLTVGEGAQVVLDGLTLTENAQIATNGAADIKLVNCRILGVKETEGKREGILKSASWDDEVTLDVQGCYFGDNAGMYNLFESNCTLQSNSIVKDCYFSENSYGNNAINLYKVADGAYINIVGNVFENSKNAVRVACKGAVDCVVNITNNTYYKTSDVPEYAGLVLIQPYGKATTDMSGVTVNISGTKNESGLEQVVYYYTGSNNSQFTASQMPKVFVDGVQVVFPASVE